MGTSSGTISEISSLTGLRFLAFFAVFNAHLGIIRTEYGDFGVTLFFFLSGYLITTLLRYEIETSSTISFRGFYLRRIMRIFPPLYITIFVAVLLSLVGLLKTEVVWKAVLSQILFLSNYYRVVLDPTNLTLLDGTQPLWSLAVEEHFYLFFPLLFFALYKNGRKKFAGIILVLCLFVTIWRIFLKLMITSDFISLDELYLWQATDCRIDSIMFGCFLALYNNPSLDSQKLSYYLDLFLFFLVMCVIYYTIVSDFLNSTTLLFPLQGIALIPVFKFLIVYGNTKMVNWLNSGLFRYLGNLSYTLYLFHGIPIAIFEKYQYRYIVSLSISLLYAILMFHFIEKPCMRIRKRLHESFNQNNSKDLKKY